jgi:hypothetical protein
MEMDQMQEAEQGVSVLAKYVSTSLKRTIGAMDNIVNQKSEQFTKQAVGFFSPVFIGTAVGLVVIIAMFTPCEFDDKIAGVCLDFSWFLTMVFATLMFLAAGLGIPIAIAYSDTCAIVGGIPSNVTEIFGNVFDGNDVALDVLQSCFKAPDQALSIYDVVYAASGNFDFPAEVDDALQAFTAADRYAGFDSAMTSARNNCAGQEAIIDALTDARDAYEAAITGDSCTGGTCAPDQSSNWISEAKPMLTGMIGKLQGSPDCTFLGNSYEQLDKYLCEDALGGLSTLVFVMFFLAIFGWFQVICAIVTSIRVFGRGHGQGAIHPNHFVN